MKIIKLIIIPASIIILLLAVFSCGTNSNITKPIVSDTTGIAFGTDSTFDLATWNIENYPKHNPETNDLLINLIPKLKLDCLAIQEVMNSNSLYSLIAQVQNWNVVTSSGSGSYLLAFAYNTSSVCVDTSYTIYNGMSVAFPRPPFVVKIRWQNIPIYIIINHFKAFGDNVIELGNSSDEEYRRLLACYYLDQYVRCNLNNEKVIILGDMNDQIHEPPTTNVFTPFIDRPEEYSFADMSIATALTPQNCSYPKSNSHIDHILITNELFIPFTNANNFVKTITLENYIVGGWTNYENYLSDHRPIAVRLRLTM